MGRARGAGRVIPVLMAVALAVLALGSPGEARIIVEEDLDQPPALQSSDQPAAPQDPEAIARWIDSVVVPIPEGPQIPLSRLRAEGGSAWGSFRTPFPSLPVWNPSGTKRVGLQAGHWQFLDSADELADLRANPGTSGGGRAEWEVNLDIAQRVAALLQEAGVEVDILPTRIPVRYRAHAFIAIHADGDASGVLTGYKVARSGWSGIPETDDALVEALNEEYGPATGLKRQDNQISRRMLWYYAFNARRYQHAVAPGVPQAIIETGFLTNYSDRRILLGDPDLAARGIANGVLRFLQWEASGKE